MRESIFGPSEFVDFIHTIQLEIAGADISFTSPLTFNSTLDSGWIYIKDIFKIYHYENYLYTMALSGQEITDYLEYSYGNWFNEMGDENDHLILFAKDENGKIKFSSRYNTPETEERFYNYSSAAGSDYAVDVTKPEGERITITSLSEKIISSGFCLCCCNKFLPGKRGRWTLDTRCRYSKGRFIKKNSCVHRRGLSLLYDKMDRRK